MLFENLVKRGLLIFQSPCSGFETERVDLNRILKTSENITLSILCEHIPILIINIGIFNFDRIRISKEQSNLLHSLNILAHLE